MEPKHRDTEGFKSRVTAQYGSYNTPQETAETGGRIGRFDYYASQSYRYSTGSRAMRLPFRARCFDAVVCFAAFPHFEDKGQALKEMARVARPGAPLLIAHLLSRSELLAHHGTHSAVAGDALPEESRMLPIRFDLDR